MELNDQQLFFYKKNGYLFVEALFDSREIDYLRQGISSFETLKGEPNVICEENGTIRSVFAPHKSSSRYEKFYKNDRLVTPCKELIEDEIYLYQFKLNLKKAFNGDCWEWHQDFAYWHLDDDVSKPSMISVMVLLQDIRSYQGSLMIIPKTHEMGIVKFQEKEYKNDSLRHSLSNDLKYTVSNDLVREMCEKNGIVNIEGDAGSCVFFHPNIFHASNSNISPFDRDTAIITYNSVNNIDGPLSQKRPDYLCSQDKIVLMAGFDKLID